MFLIIISYFFLAKAGLALASINNTASPVWPASGFAIGSAFVFGYRIVFPVFLGAFLVNLTTSVGILTALSIAIGNSLETIFALLLISKFQFIDNNFGIKFGNLRLLIVCLISTLIASIFGTAALILNENLTFNHAPDVWITWWIGDLLGALVIAPLFLDFKKSYFKINLLYFYKYLFYFFYISINLIFIYLVFNYFKNPTYAFLLFPSLFIFYKKTSSFFTNIMV